MIRALPPASTILAVAMFAPAAPAQVRDFQPVTDAMLRDPDSEDWLMFSRTYDAQRFSPLDQIHRDNVGRLGLAGSRGLAGGTTETIPTVNPDPARGPDAGRNERTGEARHGNGRNHSLAAGPGPPQGAVRMWTSF